MLNEGILTNNATTIIKSEMINQLRRLGGGTAQEIEQAVFKAIVGHDPQEIDWDIEDNHAGYYTWVKAFDFLVTELVEDGYLLEEPDENGGRTLRPTEPLPAINYSHLGKPTYATR